MSAVRVFGEATLPFHNPELANLVLSLPTGRYGQQEVRDFIELLKDTDLSQISLGNELFKEQLKKGVHINNSSSVASLMTALRAYPFETKELILWAHEETQIPDNSSLMDFFSMFGLLNKRATHPADFVYEATGIEIPKPLNRLLSLRQKALSIAQRGFWEPE